MPIKSPLESIPVETKPFGTRLLEAIWNHGIADPSKKAFICAENPTFYITYKQLYVECLSVATFLEAHGFQHGDMACLVLPNSWEFFEIMVGTFFCGGGVSGASMLFTDYELGRQFIDSRAKIVFCADNSLDRVIKAAKRATNIRAIVVIQLSDRAEKLPDDLPFGIIKFDDVLSTLPNLQKSNVNIDVKRDVLLLPYSSGTTGPPKGVMLTHQSFSTMISIFSQHYKKYVYPKLDPTWQVEKESILQMLPFYHIYGVGLLCTQIINGQTGIVLNHFDKHVFLRSIQDFKIRYIFLAPPILVFLANEPLIDEYDLSSLEFGLSGAAPAGADICKKAMQRLSNFKKIDQGYGMTECSMCCTMPVIDKIEPLSDHVGVLLSNFEAKTIDENGNELPFGTPGELCIRSPTLMLGYLGRPQATADSIDDDGWYHTGDLARIDEKARVYVLDRLKELIKVKGYQVAPAELEDLLLSHHDISDAAVIGIPDPTYGEVPYAFIVRKNPLLTEQQVHEFVNDRVANYKRLSGGLKFVDSVPKSAAGKILRRFLRDTVNKNIKSKL